VLERATQEANGTITLQDLLKGRSRAVVRERQRLRLARRAAGTSNEQPRDSMSITAIDEDR
jgi:hypothetical protein